MEIGNFGINKRLGGLNTTFDSDLIKKEKQLHVSARGHHPVGSQVWEKIYLCATPGWIS
jgi:hypothetical protein